MDKHRKFLDFVYFYVKENPDVTPQITEFIQMGLNDALIEVKNRAADMDSSVAILMRKRITAHDRQTVLDKIKKWRDKSTCRWDWLLGESDKK